MVSESPKFTNEVEQTNQKVEHHVMSRFFYDHFLRQGFVSPQERGPIVNSLREARFYPGIHKEGKGKLKYLLYIAKIMFGRLFKRKEKEFESLLDELEEKTFTNDEEMLTTVIDAIYGFAIDKDNNFTREELEERYRLTRKDRIPLNDILDFNIDKKNAEKIKVHLLGTSSLTLGKIKEGFGILADKLQKDTKLREVKTVTLTSWLIKDRPDFFEKLGFTVMENTEEDTAKEVRRSEMTKEDFIEKYVNINTK